MIHHLEDVRVLTVGLVSKGANQEEFFLLKSAETEEDMTNAVEVELQELEEKTPSTFQRWLEAGRQFFARGTEKALEPEVDEAVREALTVLAKVKDGLPENGQKAVGLLAALVGYGYPKPYYPAYPAPAKKELEALVKDAVAELGAKHETEMAKLRQEIEAAKTETQAARSEVEATRTEREKREMLELAKSFSAISVKPDELAEHFQAIAKAAPDQVEWFKAVLAAINRQAEEAKALYGEVGTTQIPEESSLLEKAEALVKAGGASDFKTALLRLDAQEANAFLRARRQDIRGGS